MGKPDLNPDIVTPPALDTGSYACTHCEETSTYMVLSELGELKVCAISSSCNECGEETVMVEIDGCGSVCPVGCVDLCYASAVCYGCDSLSSFPN